MKHLIIDGSNLIHRAHWIAEAHKNLNVYHLFLSSIKKLLVNFNTNKVFCTWDAKLVPNSTNYRFTLTRNQYKGNRDRERNERVHANQDVIVSMLECLGIKNIYPGVLEADDVIYWLCKHSLPNDEKVIVSADQDLLQLIDENTSVYSPIKDIIIDSNNFELHTKVSIDQFIDYKSLMGDKSDNIPGVPGCGPKTARKYIRNGIKASLTKKDYDLYQITRKVVDLTQGIKEHPQDADMYEEQTRKMDNLKPDLDRFKVVCESYNLKQMIGNISTFRRILTQVNTDKVIENTINDLVKRLNLV